MLPIQPTFISATPLMMFTSQNHRAVLLSHIQSVGPAHYDSLVMVNRNDAQDYCLIVALESEAADRPPTVVLYNAKGRHALSADAANPIGRQNFLAAAIFVANNLLQEQFQPVVAPQGKPALLEKPLREFYPDLGPRLNLHYTFSHRWLPAYVNSDPARFFGYLQRGDMEPTEFIQARWQLMEQDLKVIPPPTLDQLIIRRVTDLQMSVDMSQRNPMVVVQMPTPECRTHAYFVGIVLVHGEPPAAAPAKPNVRYFTLEKIDEHSPGGLLCEWSIIGQQFCHGNYGTMLPAMREPFVGAVLAILHKPAASS